MSIINNRFSTRNFEEKEIGKEAAFEIVKAGMISPSSKNKRPRQFIILDDKNLINKFSNFHKNLTILEKANKAIIVCADLECDERETHSVMACCVSTENILLKATELEIGSIWLGIYPDKERIKFVKEKLNIPDDKFPVSLIAIGYKKDSKARNRWK